MGRPSPVESMLINENKSTGGRNFRYEAPKIIYSVLGMRVLPLNSLTL